MKEPAVAPAAAKQAIEEKFGCVPNVLTCISGSTPKFRLIHSEYVYLDFW